MAEVSTAFRNEVLLLAYLLAACSSELAYEGLKSSKQHECQRYPEPERSQCLEEAGLSFDEYEREQRSTSDGGY